VSRSSAAPAAEALVSSSSSSGAAGAPPVVDESQPVATVNIRLHGGRRLAAFNVFCLSIVVVKTVALQPAAH
jgi:hypothetical protein